jgi:hypothetical protein
MPLSSSSNDRSTASPKEPYDPPQIGEIGLLKDLTAGKSGANVDAQNGSQ